jgi:zinc transport system substrate-binding protein
MPRKSLISLIILISLSLTFALVFWNHKPKIVTTFFPLYDLTKQIAGDKFEVSNLAGKNNPHNYEPTSQDLKLINSSKLLVWHGRNLDTWLEKSLPEIQTNGVKVLKASQDLELKNLPDNQIDPHFWLDPVLTKEAVKNIGQSIVDLDSINRDFYQKNTDNLLSKLDNLDKDYKTSLATCSIRQFSNLGQFSDMAFGYLARYNLEEIVDRGRAPTGLILQLATLETPQDINGDYDTNYFSLMQNNLYILKGALGCKTKDY